MCLFQRTDFETKQKRREEINAQNYCFPTVQEKKGRNN